MTVIKIENIHRRFKVGDSVVHALNDVSFDINKGEMVAIMGTSGSGKTTLMNILGCLDRPDDGRYLLNGEDVSKLHKDRLAEIRNRHIGFVFQSFNLIPRMSALENVELPILYAGGSDAKKRAIDALEIVGLTERMYHEPNKLSGGERQRVAIARALVGKPSLLLADEPTGNLDSRTTDEIMNIFAELNNNGLTIITVTHDQDIGDKCKRVIRMKDGAIISDTMNGVKSAK